MATTVTSEFWGTGYALSSGKANSKKKVAFHMRKPGMRKTKELMLTLNGAAAGSAASSTYKRVAHASTNGNAGAVDGGGKVSTETVTVVSANTTAADKTDIDEILTTDGQRFPSTYVEDASGNGGGGKGGGY